MLSRQSGDGRPRPSRRACHIGLGPDFIAMKISQPRTQLLDRRVPPLSNPRADRGMQGNELRRAGAFGLGKKDRLEMGWQNATGGWSRHCKSTEKRAAVGRCFEMRPAVGCHIVRVAQE